ncbi:spore germination protein [Heyndrickxia acidiproducens]|uniref:spore germination protein n=1 Tax=Heyndrickxia acidiproducens TaxID=1121084 RepID=UPI0003608399|nr:spore germination protein [Heyndrickxia acidiproducens]
MDNTGKKRPIPDNPEVLETFFKEHVGLGVSYDIGVRKVQILKKELQLYYLNGLVDTMSIIQILKTLFALNKGDHPSNKAAYELIQNQIAHMQVETAKTLDEMVDRVLSGLIAIVVEGENEAIIIDVRNYPGRTPMEPDTEKVVRGSRDGYVENIVFNTALTRRRIRDERLRFEMMKVGERSKTDVSIAYIDGVADPELIETVRREIKAIDTDGITMADKTVEEFLQKQGFNPFPLIRYTERADVGAAHLLEGHVLIFVDTSPSVMITPTTVFHHMQHAEEYRQAAAVGTFIRWVRFLGIFTSIFLLPLWYLVSVDTALLPDKLEYIGPNKESHIPLILQLLIADLGVEFMRIAAIHTPTPLATAMGLIAAVMVGEIAVEVGLFVSEVILYVSAAAIGTFVTPSYELSVANKIARVTLLIAVGFFQVKGFVIGSTVFLLFLVSIRSLNTPYFWPFIPFNPMAFLQIIFRRPVPGSKLRPSIVHPGDRFRQPPDA